MGALDGRVAIITGAGRGLGREHALLFAAEGAKVVVNDRGGANDGSGADDVAGRAGGRRRSAPPAARRSSNGDDIADWDGAQSLINAAIDAFGDLDILVNNAGILRDRVLVNMTEEEWDDVVRVHLKGHFAPSRWAAAYWREQTKAGNEQAAQHRPHLEHVGPVVEPGPEQLRRGQVGHRHVQPDPGQGARALRREEQLHRPRRPHPPHAGHARARRDHGRQGGRVRRVGPGERLPARVPTWHRPTARSTARRSSSRAARSSGSRAGRWPRPSSRPTRGPWPRSARRWPPASLTDRAASRAGLARLGGGARCCPQSERRRMRWTRPLHPSSLVNGHARMVTSHTARWTRARRSAGEFVGWVVGFVRWWEVLSPSLADRLEVGDGFVRWLGFCLVVEVMVAVVAAALEAAVVL